MSVGLGPGSSAEYGKQTWRRGVPSARLGGDAPRLLLSSRWESPCGALGSARPTSSWLLIGCSSCPFRKKKKRSLRSLRKAENTAECWLLGAAGSVRDGECPPRAAAAGAATPREARVRPAGVVVARRRSAGPGGTRRDPRGGAPGSRPVGAAPKARCGSLLA